jgi:hypothetical protein
MDMAIDRPTMAAGVAMLQRIMAAMLRRIMAGGAAVTMADIEAGAIAEAGVVAVIMVAAAITEAARFTAVVDATNLSLKHRRDRGEISPEHGRACIVARVIAFTTCEEHQFALALLAGQSA